MRTWPGPSGPARPLGTHPPPGPERLLTNARRVAFQHGQLLPCGRIPDLHEALVCADGHQVPLGRQNGQERASGPCVGTPCLGGRGAPLTSPRESLGPTSFKVSNTRPFGHPS